MTADTTLDNACVVRPPPGEGAFFLGPQLLLGTACGLLIAGVYHIQPLTGLIGADLGMPAESVGLLVTLPLIGYGVGLLMIVPLRDLFENRRLVLVLVGAEAVCLLAISAIATSFAFLAAECLMGAVAAGRGGGRGRASHCWAVADRGFGRVGTALAMLLASATFGLPELTRPGWHLALGLVVVAAVLLDFSVFANLVFSQRPIFALDPERRNRLNGLFMASFFAGGAIGSVLSGWCYAAAGWTGGALLGAALPVLGLLYFATECFKAVRQISDKRTRRAPVFPTWTPRADRPQARSSRHPPRELGG